MLTEKDFLQIEKKNSSIDKVKSQLQDFENGFSYADIIQAATPHQGIITIDEENQTKYVTKYENEIQKGLNVAKFVPASGAATRMFKSLFEYLHASPEQQVKMATDQPYSSFLAHLKFFAFYEDLKSVIPDFEHQKENLSQSEFLKIVLEALLNAKGLDYGALPKGLLKFHQYDTETSTPLEEHLREAVSYAADASHKAAIHFTVSPEHHERFLSLVANVKPAFEKEHNVQLDISFSYQKSSTDTIAVNPDNTPFRTATGELLFRPGGHGALIENLNDLDHELVFIKNIDNVVPAYLQPDTIQYKKVLAGLLLEKRDHLVDILTGLDKDHADATQKGFEFINGELKIEIPQAVLDAEPDKQKQYIISHLNRPIRICGMVKNEGEPGGGPFWVKQPNGDITLQIVEGAQIDPKNVEKQNILSQSTHFNPVDLICYLNDYRGIKFDLTPFVDKSTGFISEKTQNGKPLKALELPGLWNGAMANWLTFFVEVPITTFNPVKTVMDLLRPQHQPQREAMDAHHK